MKQKMTQKTLSLLLCLVMLLTMLPVTPAAAAGSVISINQGSSSLAMSADHPDYVRDLWSAADTADGLVFDYTLSMNKADIIKANNAIAEADGDDSRLLGTEYRNNGELELEVMVELRRSEGEEITSIRGSATYSLFEYDLENESNRYYNQWGCWDTDGQDFLKVTASGDNVTVALDATLQELEAYAGEPIGYIFVYAAVRGQAYYFRYGRYQDTRPSIVTGSAGFSIYDAHQRETEIDSERMIALDRILTVRDYAPSAGNMSEEEYAKYYEPVSRRYVWTYDISREGYFYNEETDETLYPGSCFRDMEGDGIATEVYNGILYGGVRGTYDAGANAGVSLRQMLPAEHLAFVETLKGVEPSGDGGEARINLNFTLYVTYPDGSEIELWGGVADETTMIAGVCLHSCTVCSMCTSSEILACNSRYGWRTNLCTCQTPSPAIVSTSITDAQILEDQSFCYQDGVTARVETFNAELAVTTDYYKAVTKNLGSQDVLAVYDITLYNSYDEPITINEWGGEDEYVTVRIPVSPEIAAAAAQGLLTLYHVDRDGLVEEITVTADTVNNTITFTGTRFSPFVLTQKPASIYYGRSQLAKLANAKALLYAYDQLAAGVEAAQTDINIYNGETYLTVSETAMVMDAYVRDYAHHFWLANSWGYSHLSGKVVSVKLNYLMTGAALDAARAAFDAAAAEILSGITPSMSENEKELYLHDAIASRVSYVDGANAHNAYGALVEGKAVCEGYSEAFQYLLQQADIQSYIVLGTSKGENHAWNAVKIGGEWYHVDLTWDDQGEELYHAYFNITDARLLEDHVISTADIPAPVCTAEGAFYFTGKDTLLSTYDVASVAKLLKDNGGKVHVYIPGDVQTFLDWYNGNIMDIIAQTGASGSISCSNSALSHEVHLSMSGLGGCAHNYESVVTPPTCTLGGYTTHTCSLCADTYTDSETPALDHTWQAATCSAPKTCSVCGATEGEANGSHERVDCKCIHCGSIGGKMGDNVYWELKDGVMTISGTGPMENYYLNSHPDWYEHYFPSVYEVVIEEGITHIGNYSFYYCHNLCSISIPDSVTSIGQGAFIGNYNLTEVTIPEGVTVIENNTFEKCERLQTVDLPDSLKEIDYCAFQNCLLLKTVDIPDGVTRIGHDAFDDCNNLTQVKLPANLELIERNAFAYTALQSVVIPDNGVSIEKSAFFSCSKLKQVVIPKSTVLSGDGEVFLGTELEEVYYGGTAAEWEAQKREPAATYIHYECTEPAGHWQTVKQDATCEEDGFSGERCACGYERNGTVTPSTGHSYTPVVTDPTCTADGYTTYTCHCGYSYTDQITAKLGHSMDAEWTVITVATCTAEGVRRKDCARCDHYVTEVIPVSAHTPEAVPGKDPTCTATGLTEGSKCSVCGTTLTEQTVLPKLDHTEEEVPAVAPGCTTEGLSAGKKCSVCGITLQAQTTVPATGHSWTGGVCGGCAAVCDHSYDANGICTVCGLGCTHDYKSDVTAPTCTEQGYTTYTCDICGNQYKGDYLPALDHSWQAATCTAPKTCTVCAATEGTPNGHNYSSLVTAPTCTADGFTTYTCHCGHSYTGDTVAKLGHEMSDWTVTQAATCTAEGSRRRDCIRCDHYETEVIGATGHTFGQWEITKAATCTAEGSRRRDCTACDHYETEVIGATGHTFGQWETTKEATCTADGSKRRDCTACDHYETEVIKATGHSYTSKVTAPTCTADGFTTYTCSKCSHSYTGNSVAKLGHNMGAWTVTTQPTASAKGKETRKCSRCDYTESREVAYKGNVLKLETKELQSQTTVWINGLPYPVQGTGTDRYVELPTADTCYMVTYTWHIGDSKDVHTQYPTGMKVYKISGGKATHIPELDNLLQYSGASIRITGKKGIRMITSLNKNTKASLTGKGLAGYKLEEYGTVLAFASEVKADGDLVLGKSYSRSNYAYKKGVADPVFANSGNLVQYTNVLVGFNLDQCTQDIAMRPYIILSDASGNKVTLYGGTVYRSIGYIAYQNRTVFQPKTASYNYVWEIIHHVYGKQYDKDYKG